jgi:molybdopterin/thiamine biosynthesis adenylyltransferase
MSAANLTAEAKRENARALAAAAGVTVDTADQALDVTVLITAESSDATADLIANEAHLLLERTVTKVSRKRVDGLTAVELVIGMAAPRTRGPYLFLSVFTDRAVISSRDQYQSDCAGTHGILVLLCAAYACGQVLRVALGENSPVSSPDPFVLPFDVFCQDQRDLAFPVDVGRSHLAGAGAIGNGFLWAARHLDIRGELHVVDDDYVSSGNLNRQIWFDRNDINEPKATRLCEKAQRTLPNLALIAHQARLQDLRSDDPWLRRLVVAVDSRRARRALQNEFPGEVFDASTTDLREIVVHHHREPNAYACLSCIYELDEQEVSRESHIAEHLGVAVDEVRTERISTSAASIIVQRFKDLNCSSIVGVAYDTLFKQLCSSGKLTTTQGEALTAPFAFISVLAGTLLALDMVRVLGQSKHVPDFNYWRLSPWHPPLERRRVLRPKQVNCTFCGDMTMRKVNHALWGTSSPAA